MTKEEAWKTVKAMSDNFKKAKKRGDSKLASIYKETAQKFVKSLSRKQWEYVLAKAKTRAVDF